jgi:hypothetical protein
MPLIVYLTSHQQSIITMEGLAHRYFLRIKEVQDAAHSLNILAIGMYFPIHRLELANVGLTEDDLLEWLKFLNDLKIGMEIFLSWRTRSSCSISSRWNSYSSLWYN